MSILFVLAFAIPGAFSWAIVGAIGDLGSGRWRWFIGAFIALYSWATGMAELRGRAGNSLSSRWQVPAYWVRGRSEGVKTLIWGAVLGPGFLTRNPFAGFATAAGLAFLSGNAWGAGIIGAAHVIFRALGILRNQRQSVTPEEAPQARRIQYRALRLDGALLVLIASSFACWGVLRLV